jgi:hypothetical protein
MQRIFFAVAAFAALSGCAFSAAQEANVGNAIALQGEALLDRNFAEIMRELDGQGAIDWRNRLDETAAAEALAHARPVEWLLARFERDGGLSRSQVKAWRKWNPLSSTTASTAPHVLTRLNLWRLTSDQISLANTLTHERTHFFGILHPDDQTRPTNKCDAAYVSGDLSEALLASRPGTSRTIVTKNVCPALCSALARRGLWSPCTGSS